VQRNVPFDDVRFFVGHHERSVMCGLVMFIGMSDYASYLGSSDLQDLHFCLCIQGVLDGKKVRFSLVFAAVL